MSTPNIYRAKVDDRSEEHLTWLVKSRSDNQETSLRLYLLLEANPVINASIDLQQIARALTAVAFSLWRAVFLSNLKGESDEQMADLNTFLGNLISNNTIAYQQDKTAREFTFRYYLSDAELRLEEMSKKFPAILKPEEFVKREARVKAEWTSSQSALDIAIGRFRDLLSMMQ